MKSSSYLPVVVAAGWIFFCGACQLHSKSDNSSQLLSSPPYAGITDSIGKFPNEAHLYLERAVLLSQNNRHDLATDDYKKAWTLAPDDNTALEYATNLMLVQRADDALALLKDGEKKFPSNAEFSRRISELYAQMGKSREAISRYDAMLRKDSLNFETWYEKGMLESRLGDTAAAIRSLQRSYAIEPINYTGLALANLYASMLDPRTVAICDELIKKDSLQQMTDALFIKGTYYADARQYGRAMKAFDECIRRDWKFTDAYIEKGIALFEQKNYDSALHVFTLASTVSNTSADTWYWMARCNEAKGDNASAIENYQRALALDPGLAEAKQALKRLKK